jgi:hypothetical protein
MHSTTSAAHRRVGAAAVLAFLALLGLGLTRSHSAAADPVVPVATPTVQPEQPLPQQSQPQTPPFNRGGGGGDDGGGRGFRGGDGGRGFGGGGNDGGGGFGGGGGGTAPAPSTGGSTGGNET